MNTENMNTKKHTPGPWKFHIGRGVDPRFHIQTQGGLQIAETPKNGIACGIKEVNEANARLIASAPELLEASQNVLFYLRDRAPKEYEQLRRAIAKATE